MDGATFMEWVAYDSIEPVDPAGALLAGFSKPQPEKATGWEQQMQLMQTFFPGKKDG